MKHLARIIAIGYSVIATILGSGVMLRSIFPRTEFFSYVIPIVSLVVAFFIGRSVDEYVTAKFKNQ